MHVTESNGRVSEIPAYTLVAGLACVRYYAPPFLAASGHVHASVWLPAATDFTVSSMVWLAAAGSESPDHGFRGDCLFFDSAGYAGKVRHCVEKTADSASQPREDAISGLHFCRLHQILRTVGFSGGPGIMVNSVRRRSINSSMQAAIS
jgi:hypothetical protein